MTPDEVLAVAEAGAARGAKRLCSAWATSPNGVSGSQGIPGKAWVSTATLEYLAAMSELVLEKTGLLPHSNPGVMGAERSAAAARNQRERGTDARKRQPCGYCASWRRALEGAGQSSLASLRTIEERRAISMAFTTGILIGIGETLEERVDALLAIRAAQRNYGHIQEVIVQPFRAKTDTRMALAPEPSTDDLQRTIAVAPLAILGGEMNIQSPPNLLSEDYPDLLKAGINDWGGISPVTKDFINPEAAWPQISSLAARSAGAGSCCASVWRSIRNFPRGRNLSIRASQPICEAPGRRRLCPGEEINHAETENRGMAGNRRGVERWPAAQPQSGERAGEGAGRDRSGPGGRPRSRTVEGDDLWRW